ncbi:MAG: amidohydrolase [Hyphomonadaceae bacterium]|nr:amidohydrolase [Hyphomonadaceae bacterium]
MIDRRSFVGGSALLGTAGAAQASPCAEAAAPAPHRPARSIAVEEAFAVPEQFEAMRRLLDAGGTHDLEVDRWRPMLSNMSSRRVRELLDIDGERLERMTATGLSMHVLSLTSPGVQTFDADTAVGVAAAANDRLAEACRRHPTRFAGLASFAPQDPRRAAREIERAMTRLNLNGLIVNSHTRGEYLDAPKFEPILEAAAATGAAIYIHPRLPPAAMAQYYMPLTTGERPESGFYTLMGFTAETLLHGMRLIVSGVFDKYPKLKIVLGHMGEGLPYLTWKLDSGYEIFGAYSPSQRTRKLPSQYIKENFLFTTSGFFSQDNLEYMHRVVGPDGIMFAVDYPYYKMEDGMAFLNATRLPKDDVDKLAFRNAERVFRIPSA